MDYGPRSGQLNSIRFSMHVLLMNSPSTFGCIRPGVSSEVGMALNLVMMAQWVIFSGIITEPRDTVK
jgi:hypothetical protein